MTDKTEHHVLVVMRAAKDGVPAIQLFFRPHDYYAPPRWRAYDKVGIFGGPIVPPDPESHTSGESAVHAAIRNIKTKFKLGIDENDVTFLEELPVQSDGVRYTLVEIDLDLLVRKGLNTNEISGGKPWHLTEAEANWLINGQSLVHEVTAKLLVERRDIFFGTY